MKEKKLHIGQKDFMLAIRRAEREDEIRLHGRPVSARPMLHRSKKTYNRKRLKNSFLKSESF